MTENREIFLELQVTFDKFLETFHCTAYDKKLSNREKYNLLERLGIDTDVYENWLDSYAG